MRTVRVTRNHPSCWTLSNPTNRPDAPCILLDTASIWEETWNPGVQWRGEKGQNLQDIFMFLQFCWHAQSTLLRNPPSSACWQGVWKKAWCLATPRRMVCRTIHVLYMNSYLHGWISFCVKKQRSSSGGINRFGRQAGTFAISTAVVLEFIGAMRTSRGRYPLDSRGITSSTKTVDGSPLHHADNHAL